jgi:hypothetical protein
MCVVDGEPASFYSETWPRARKPHRCYDCDVMVPVGVRYLRVAGKWDGRVDAYVHCETCAALAAAVIAADCSYLFGSLHDDAAAAIDPHGLHSDADPVALGTIAGLLFRHREAAAIDADKGER